MEDINKEWPLLNECCPICGTNLFAYPYRSMADIPESELWFAECNNVDCTYFTDDAFISLEDLLKTHTIKQ